jgi:hypothetical protein
MYFNLINEKKKINLFLKIIKTLKVLYLIEKLFYNYYKKQFKINKKIFKIREC